jgi:hypothetical protein
LPISKRQSTKKIRLSDYFDEDTSSKWRKADESLKDAVKSAVGEYIVSQINSHLDRAESPVEGGAYERTLAKKKGQRGLPRLSRLLESGDMRSQITYLEDKGTQMRVGIFSSAAKLDRLKASGHNLGDSVTGTQRQFIPFEDGAFKKSIEEGIARTIRQALESGEEDSDAS